MEIRMKRLILRENECYEIDEECRRQKERQNRGCLECQKKEKKQNDGSCQKYKNERRGSRRFW